MIAPRGCPQNFGGCGGDGCGAYDELGRITSKVLELWPRSVPVTYLPFETGVDVRTGGGLARRNLQVSPCDRAYYVYRRDDWGGPRAEDEEDEDWGGRSSWDPMALLYAVRGASGYYEVQEGRYSIDADSGHTTWTPC
eukprot:7386793-Prymnesium_polylepis.1